MSPRKIIYLSVMRCELRGRQVDIEFRDNQSFCDVAILDTQTRERIAWALTEKEIVTLERVLMAP